LEQSRVTQDSDPSTAAGFILRFEARAGYLFAEVTGARSSGAITLAYWQKIAAECARLKARKLMVVDHFRGNAVSPAEMATCVHALADSPLRKVRIAFYEPEAENLSTLQYAELEALEVGFSFRVFANERDAEIWLTHGY
jgi:hypothetical protein